MMFSRPRIPYPDKGKSRIAEWSLKLHMSNSSKSIWQFKVDQPSTTKKFKLCKSKRNSMMEVTCLAAHQSKKPVSKIFSTNINTVKHRWSKKETLVTEIWWAKKMEQQMPAWKLLLKNIIMDRYQSKETITNMTTFFIILNVTSSKIHRSLSTHSQIANLVKFMGFTPAMLLCHTFLQSRSFLTFHHTINFPR